MFSAIGALMTRTFGAVENDCERDVELRESAPFHQSCP
jgi:hypothetical protein